MGWVKSRFLGRVSFMAAAIAGLSMPAAQGADKPRVLVLTDVLNEPDDTGSLVRLLTYSNELEIEGLIATTSKYLPDKVHPEHILEVLGRYEKVHANLLRPA